VKLRVVAIVIVAVATAGCAKTDMQVMKEQKAGDHTVVVCAPGGKLKQGRAVFVIEIRKSADNQPVDVGDLDVSCSMPMPGQPNMVAALTATPAGTPGRYNVTGDFEMKGAWDLTLQFGSGQKVQMPLKVQ
jgi:hypothetical protein